MKDMSEVLQINTFRLFVIYLVPGAIAVLPYWTLLFRKVPETTMEGIFFFGLATFFGLILEDIGSRIEIKLDCKLEAKLKLDDKSGVKEEWEKYLATDFESEPAGIRYMSSIVLRLKFELNAGLACIIAGFSIPCVDLPIQGFWAKLPIFCVLFAIGGYLLCEAIGSNKILHDTRTRLNNDEIYVVSK